MQCAQIRPLLDRYAAGDLPPYRAAWVAQHLAGCNACQSSTAPEPRPPDPRPLQPLQPRPPAPDWSGGKSQPVQRPVPPWVQPAAAALLLLCAAGMFWSLRTPARRSARAQAPVAPVTFEASMQRQLGVSLWLESVAVKAGRTQVTARFRGQDLHPPPGEPAAWVKVLDQNRQPVEVQSVQVRTDPSGLAVDLEFQLPSTQRDFAIGFGSVLQEVQYHWSLALPDPAETLREPAQLLVGTPPGVTLMSYGTVGDLLQIRLRTPAYIDHAAVPALSLRDASGQLFAPVRGESRLGWGSHELLLHFPLPRELRLPLVLTGQAVVRREMGPWLLEARRDR